MSRVVTSRPPLDALSAIAAAAMPATTKARTTSSHPRLDLDAGSAYGSWRAGRGRWGRPRLARRARLGPSLRRGRRDRLGRRGAVAADDARRVVAAAAPRRLQRAAHLLRVGVAVGGLELQRAVDRVGQRGRDEGVDLVEARRVLALLRERQLRQRRRLVGETPGQQLVRDDAEAVEVRAGRGDLAVSLLRRQVRGGAEHRAGLRDRGAVGRLRDAEVGQLDLALLGAQQVAGLHVAVHDAVAVRVVQPPAGAVDEMERVLDGELALVAQDLAPDCPRMYSMTM